MALIRNSLEKVNIPGFGGVPFRVQVDDDGSLSISLPAMISEDELGGGSCALGLLKRYVDERHIPYREYRRGTRLAKNTFLDTLIFHRGADLATELMAILHLVVESPEERAQ